MLNAAIAKIQEDGSVLVHDDEEGEMFPCEPHDPVDLRGLPDDVYEMHLLHAARSIASAVSHIASHPKQADRRLENLAISLTAYQHDHNFLQKALSLVKIDEKGFLHEPRLQEPEPWTPRTDKQWQVLRRALAQCYPDLPFEDWSETQTKIRERIGPTAARIYTALTDMSEDELQFLQTLATNILAERGKIDRN